MSLILSEALLNPRIKADYRVGMESLYDSLRLLRGEAIVSNGRIVLPSSKEHTYKLEDGTVSVQRKSDPENLKQSLSIGYNHGNGLATGFVYTLVESGIPQQGIDCQNGQLHAYGDSPFAHMWDFLCLSTYD